MMRYVLFVVCLVFSLNSNAQNYKSLFGSTSTQWVFRWGNLFGAVQDTLYASKDTTVHGVTYKKVQLLAGNGYYKGGLIREDLVQGHIWYRDVTFFSGDPKDTVERIIIRYDLAQGDSFNISNSNLGDTLTYPNSDNLVDSVRTISGRKYIYFRGKYKTEPYTIIEGIGTNIGLLWKHSPSLLLDQYLLCSYMNGEKADFANIKYKGDCNPPLAIGDVANAKSLKLYPNPASNVLVIENNNATKLEKIQILSIEGKMIKETTGNFNTNITIDLSAIPTGVYIVRMYSGTQAIATQLTINK